MESYFYEDIKVGDKFKTAGRTIDQSDINLFAGLSGDYNELHTNELYSHNLFKRRIAHGILTLAITSGLLYRLGIVAKTGLAHLGSTEKYLHPVFSGDTIYAELEIIAKKSRGDGAGVITAKIDTINQDGKVVLTQTVNLLVRCRDHADKNASAAEAVKSH